MPSPFIHYFFGVILADFFGYTGREKLALALISLLPDIDFVSIFLMRPLFKMTKNHPLLGRALFHRGITHTFLFSCAALLLLSVLRKWKLALFVFLSLLSHIVWDYISIWGVSPLFPFARKSYAANLFSIGDMPMTLLLFFASLSSFYARNLFIPLLVVCMLYLLARFLFKDYIARKTGAIPSSIVPTTSVHYAYAKKEGKAYEAGKFNTLSGKNETRIISSNAEASEDLSSLMDGTSQRFIEYPVFVKEGNGMKIFDARRILFPYQTPFSMVFYVEDGHIFMDSEWGKMEVPASWASW